jgi:hypothetical protein
MSEDEVNTYFASLEEPKRSTLVALWRTILNLVPEADCDRDVAVLGLPDRTWSHTFIAAIAAPETAGKEFN